jgi:hypothetical protein
MVVALNNLKKLLELQSSTPNKMRDRYVVRNMCVYNFCWEVSDRAEGHRKVARYTGVEDVKLIFLPRYLCRNLVSRARDNISPVVSFRFRCNF